MRFSRISLFLFSVFFFYLMFATVQGKADSNELLVGSSGTSVNVERAECSKEAGVECKEGNGGFSEENVFENEDYIYTNSHP